MEQNISRVLVSIIIPVYNLERYIEKCIKSVQEQTCNNLEIIVIDDGSSDSSVMLVKNLAEVDSRIKLIKQSNQGVAQARNHGLKIAQGKYIVFVDGDDWLDIDCIKRTVELAESNELDMVCWPYLKEFSDRSVPVYLFEDSEKVWHQDSIKILYRRFIGNYKEELACPEKLDSLCTVWGKLYNRDLVKDIIFYGKNTIGSTAEDVLFNIMALSNMKKAAYVSDVFYHYRKDNEQSLTHGYDFDLITKREKYYELIEQQLSKITDDIGYKEALSNRIALSFIGIGLNLVDDKALSIVEKLRELNRIVKQKQYQDAFKSIELKYLPIHWKLFYCVLKCRCILGTFILLKVMNRMRKG